LSAKKQPSFASPINFINFINLINLINLINFINCISTSVPPMKKKISTAIFALCALLAAAQTVWHVKPAASGAATGLTWADAFGDLHQALVAAQPGDAVWVAEGEYRPDAGGDRDRYFELKSGVRLYGGFAGTEASPAQRDLAAHPTVLSGNIGDPADSTDNSRTILYLAYPDSSTRVDGLTLRHGHATDFENGSFLAPANAGGAVYVMAQDGQAQPVFVDCTFRDNYARGSGGALYVMAQGATASTPLFQRCTFFNNRSNSSGGAVFYSGGNPYDRGTEYDHCRFEQNWAGQRGGAIWMANAFGNETLNFKNCVLTKNSAVLVASIMFYNKSGDKDFKIDIDSCEISYNIPAGNATHSGMYLFSVGPEFKSDIKIRNSKIFNNVDQLYGLNGSSSGVFAFFNQDEMPSFCEIVGNTLYKNKSHLASIAFSADYGVIKVARNKIWGDADGDLNGLFSAPISVGGTDITAYGNEIFDKKGRSMALGAYGTNAKINFYNNLLHHNSIDSAYQYIPLVFNANGGPVSISNNLFFKNRYHHGSQPLQPATFTAENNIFLENVDVLSGQPTLPFPVLFDSLHFRHNLMDAGCVTASCGGGNIYATDALFVDTAARDFRLRPCSPAANAGDNGIVQSLGITQDFEGNARIKDGTVDIGPYESGLLALAQAPSVTPACPGLASGAVSFAFEGGCPPYAYQWVSGAASGTGIAGLAPGLYTFDIADAKGRTLSTDVLVGSVERSLSLLGDTLTCHWLDDGFLVAELSDAAQPVAYAWSNGASASSLSGLPTGAYGVTATDAVGCRDSATVQIVDAPPLSVTASVQSASAANAADGSIALAASGLGPFHYLWETGDTLPTLAGLLPGHYSVTVGDAAGCGYVYGYQVGFTSGTEVAAAPWAGIGPNPANQGAVVFFGDFERWELYDAQGRAVRALTRAVGGKVPVSLADLPNGLYKFVFKDKKGRKQRGKLLIAH
jgi:hypothetical protein